MEYDDSDDSDVLLNKEVDVTDLSRQHNGRDGVFYQSFGRLEAMVGSHEKRLDEINDKLDTLLEASNKTKGGWLMLTAIVSSAAAIGAFATQIIEAIKRIFG